MEDFIKTRIREYLNENNNKFSLLNLIFSEEEMFVNSEEHHHEVREFVDNLTAENFEKFEQFFLSMPLLLKKIKFTCKQCEIVNNLQVDTIRNFFH